MARTNPRIAVFALLLTPAMLGCLGATDDLADPTRMLTAEGAALAPVWDLGDWWTYRVSSTRYAIEYEITLVVGETRDAGSIVGTVPSEWDPQAIILHMPPLGAIGTDLSYEVHDMPFQPFDFPLVDGKTWTTTFFTTPATFEATAATIPTPTGDEAGFAVKSAGDGTTPVIEYTYTPSVGWFVTYQRALSDGSIAERLDLVAHGTGHNGTVRLFDGFDIVYLAGRSTAVLGGDLVGAPADTFRAGATYTHLTLGCVVGGAPGSYTVRIEGTSGGCLNSRRIDPGDPTVYAELVETTADTSEWTVQFAAGGTGNAFAEVIGYQAWDVTLGEPTETST